LTIDKVSVDSLIEVFGVEAVKKCLKSINDYAFGPDVVALNLSDDDGSDFD
jgi:hypothetical protein